MANRIEARRRTGNEVYVYAIQTLVDEATYDLIRQRAKVKRMSVSAYTRHLLKKGVAIHG